MLARLFYDISKCMSIDDIKKNKRGRPKADTEAVMLRLDRDLITTLDAYRVCEPDKPGRPEAIRRLLRKVLID